MVTTPKKVIEIMGVLKGYPIFVGRICSGGSGQYTVVSLSG